MSAICGILWLCLLLPGCNNAPSEDADAGIWFFVLVKSSNYDQDRDGELTLLNYHFFSEVFPKDGVPSQIEGQLTRHDAPGTPMPYVDRGSNYYIEGGHFDSVEELDQAFPNGEFLFEISNDAVDISSELTLSGPQGDTDIPEPIQISLYQDDEIVDPTKIDADQAMTIRWSEYSNGRADPKGIVDDMIFVVVQNCQGERMVHTGLPFEEEDYLTYRARELRVDAGTLNPGEPYAMFVEFPHVIDSVVADGVPGFTSYATATYLDIHTTGEASDDSCLEIMPAMDTGQTDREPSQ
jgi:hypothetical protein